MAQRYHFDAAEVGMNRRRKEVASKSEISTTRRVGEANSPVATIVYKHAPHTVSSRRSGLAKTCPSRRSPGIMFEAGATRISHSSRYRICPAGTSKHSKGHLP